MSKGDYVVFSGQYGTTRVEATKMGRIVRLLHTSKSGMFGKLAAVVSAEELTRGGTLIRAAHIRSDSLETIEEFYKNGKE